MLWQCIEYYYMHSIHGHADMVRSCRLQNYYVCDSYFYLCRGFLLDVPRPAASPHIAQEVSYNIKNRISGTSLSGHLYKLSSAPNATIVYLTTPEIRTPL